MYDLKNKKQNTILRASDFLRLNPIEHSFSADRFESHHEYRKIELFEIGNTFWLNRRVRRFGGALQSAPMFLSKL